MLHLQCHNLTCNTCIFTPRNFTPLTYTFIHVFSHLHSHLHSHLCHFHTYKDKPLGSLSRTFYNWIKSMFWYKCLTYKNQFHFNSSVNWNKLIRSIFYLMQIKGIINSRFDLRLYTNQLSSLWIINNLES